MNLTDEEKEALRGLCAIEERGESVGSYIENLLYSELSHLEAYEPDGVIVGGLFRSEEPEFQRQLSIYEGLANKGAVNASGESGNMSFYELTSDGRRFFEMEKAAKKETRKAKWSERRFTIFMAILTFALSVLASYIIANGLIDQALMPLQNS